MFAQSWLLSDNLWLKAEPTCLVEFILSGAKPFCQRGISSTIHKAAYLVRNMNWLSLLIFLSLPVPAGTAVTQTFNQGTLSEGEGPVQLTSLN